MKKIAFLILILSTSVAVADVELPVCGNGILEITSSSEQCDDGNLVDGDGCSSACAPEFKTLKRQGVTKFNNCNMFGTQTKVRVLRGRILKFPVAGAKKYKYLPSGLKYGACTGLDTLATNDTFFAKASLEGEVTQINLTREELVNIKSILKTGKFCKKVIPFQDQMIYKTLGAEHFGNSIRRYTIGLIFRGSVSGVPFIDCVNVIDGTGKTVAKLQLYAQGGSYAARYYAGIGCASDTPFGGDAVAERAKSSSDSEDIFFDFGSTCVGPVEADECQHSKQC